MPRLSDFLNIHNCDGVTAQIIVDSGANGNNPFARRFFGDFWKIGAVFAEERGVSSFQDVLDDPGDPEMGPKSEKRFLEMCLRLNQQGVLQ